MLVRWRRGAVQHIMDNRCTGRHYYSSQFDGNSLDACIRQRRALATSTEQWACVCPVPGLNAGGTTLALQKASWIEAGSWGSREGGGGKLCSCMVHEYWRHTALACGETLGRPANARCARPSQQQNNVACRRCQCSKQYKTPNASILDLLHVAHRLPLLFCSLACPWRWRPGRCVSHQN